MVTLTTMTTTECWERIGTRGVGRIGFDRGRGPRIHPVDYTASGRTLRVRTAPGSELADFVTLFGGGALVSFQVDRVAGDGARWSVLLSARVEVLSEQEVAALRPDEQPVPTPAGPRPTVLRLKPVEVTGRRLEDVSQAPRDVVPHPYRGPAVSPAAGARPRSDNWLG